MMLLIKKITISFLFLLCFITLSAFAGFFKKTQPHPLLKLSDSISEEVAKLAFAAYETAHAEGTASKPILTVIDYSKPSTEARLWVFDLEREELLFNTLVSHGVNSGENMATNFSNVINSRASSIGTFVTAETYYGKHGYSLRMDGLEEGINDYARDRAIVFHGAHYATESFAQQNGRLGRSWGCPAVDPKVSREIIDTIKDGAVVFSYFPDDDWLASSSYVKVV